MRISLYKMIAFLTTTLICLTSHSFGKPPQNQIEVKTDRALRAPRPLLSEGSVVGSPDGYAAPTIADVNADGLPDLLIGDFGTKHGGFDTNVADLNETEQELYFGDAGQIQILFGEGQGKSFRFGHPNWASTRNGKIQSPTW